MKMLLRQCSRIVTKYGDFFVKSYPPERIGFSEDSDDSDISDDSDEDDEVEEEERSLYSLSKMKMKVILTDFVECFLPRFNPRFMSMNRLITTLNSYGAHTALMHIPTSIFIKKKSVEYLVVNVQCFLRRAWARMERKRKLRLFLALIRCQKAFKRYIKKLHRMARIIQGIF
jgi:hypothetical protein